MGTFLLVHGACHGGWCWRKVNRILRDKGHEVFSPTLTGLGERTHLITPSTNNTVDTFKRLFSRILVAFDIRGVF